MARITIIHRPSSTVTIAIWYWRRVGRRHAIDIPLCQCNSLILLRSGQCQGPPRQLVLVHRPSAVGRINELPSRSHHHHHQHQHHPTLLHCSRVTMLRCDLGTGTLSLPHFQYHPRSPTQALICNPNRRAWPRLTLNQYCVSRTHQVRSFCPTGPMWHILEYREKSNQDQTNRPLCVCFGRHSSVRHYWF